MKITKIYLKKLKQDYPNFGLTFLYEYQYINSNRTKWTISDINGPQKLDQWEFYDGHFVLKGRFPLGLTKILNFPKNVSNATESIKTPPNLKDLLVGSIKKIEKISKEIDGLVKLTLLLDTFFLYNNSNLAKKLW